MGFSAESQDIDVVDLDNDGDMDVLSSFEFDNKIVLFANDGSGNFEYQQIIENAIMFSQLVHTADLDNDGDMDILSFSLNNTSNNDNIVWYENLLPPIGINTVNSSSMTVFYCYPNPTNTHLSIQQATNEPAFYTLYNAVGQLVATGTFSGATHTFSVAHLPSGWYYLEVNGEHFNIIKE